MCVCVCTAQSGSGKKPGFEFMRFISLLLIKEAEILRTDCVNKRAPKEKSQEVNKAVHRGGWQGL